jgi:hypothetical protein
MIGVAVPLRPESLDAFGADPQVGTASRGEY